MQKHANDELVNYSDGSPEDGFQSASYVIINNGQMFYRSFDISHINPNSRGCRYCFGHN